jgi:hypothetical protein
MVGLIEATHILGQHIDQVDLLSIGTTYSPFDGAVRVAVVVLWRGTGVWSTC